MRKRLFFISLLFLPVVFSCVNEIDFNNDPADRIVVNCLLTSDSVQYLNLTHNAQKGDSYFQDVEEATATLSSDGEVVGIFKHYEYGRWTLNFTPEAGRKYKLNISVDGFDDISAETTFPAPAKVSKSSEKGKYYRRYFVQQKTDNIFWMFYLTQNSDSLMDVPVIHPSDRLEESIGTSHPGADEFNALDNLMFAASGGAGITQEHLAYIRVLPEQGQQILQFCVEGNLAQSLVVFRSVSDEYDRYLKSSMMKMMLHMNFEDPTAYLDESSVYSNIKGGLGIFGAYRDRIIQFSPISDGY
jgi:hypothetical protein